MVEVLIGMISGMITAIGLGGGTVLILLLTLGLEVTQRVAQATNLLFFVPTAVTAIILNLREKNIELKIGINLIFWGVIGAILGSILANGINVGNLRKLFGFFLLCIAAHEIYSFYKLYIKEKNTNNKIDKRQGGM